MAERADLPQLRVTMTRVQRASDQVAVQLRDMIVSGALPEGTRLPSETELARQSGVSRATLREALQTLATEGLTRRRRGVGGGTFVTLPSPDDVTDTLRLGVALLSAGNNITVDELLETRELLEVPAAALAAQRRTDDDIACMRSSIPGSEQQLPAGEEFVHNRTFHHFVLRAAHNSLLSIATHPVHHVLVNRLEQAQLTPGFHAEIHRHHADIADAIEERDPDAARRLMEEHLAWLRPHHERIWGNRG